jgi:hypothetical protein
MGGQERFGKDFTDARAEPEFVEEIGKGAWILVGRSFKLVSNA